MDINEKQWKTMKSLKTNENPLRNSDNPWKGNQEPGSPRKGHQEPQSTEHLHSQKSDFRKTSFFESQRLTRRTYLNFQGPYNPWKSHQEPESARKGLQEPKSNENLLSQKQNQI